MNVLGWCFGCGGRVPWMGEDSHLLVTHATPAGASELSLQRARPCGPVWPGVRVHDQAELEAKAPGLLRIEAPGHWVEWVPGRGRLELYSVALDEDTKLEPFTGHLWTREHGYLPEPDRPPIKWLRISAEVDGLPIDIADIRSVVRAAQVARVRVWIERLGSHLTWNGNGDPFPPDTEVTERYGGRSAFNAHLLGGGADPDGWPWDLRACRELPEVGR